MLKLSVSARESAAARQGAGGAASAFEQTVAGLCDAVARQRCDAGDAAAGPRGDEVLRYVLDQHGRMPDFLAFAFRIATLGFDLLGLAHGGRLFHRAPVDTRWRQIEAWRRSPVSIPRDFVRFYESLIVQRWYEGWSAEQAAAGESRHG